MLGLQVSVNRAVPVQVALSSGQLEFVFRLTRVCLPVCLHVINGIPVDMSVSIQ